MSDRARVTAEREGDRIVVHVATGPRPWSFRLAADDAAELERALAAARESEAHRPAERRETERRK